MDNESPGVSLQGRRRRATSGSRARCILQRIVLRMQEDLIHLPMNDHLLQLSNSIASRHTHGRRTTNEHASSLASPFLTHLSEHVWDIRTTPLGTPTALLGFHRRRHESETHEVLLELRGRRWETKVELLWIVDGGQLLQGLLYVIRLALLRRTDIQ